MANLLATGAAWQAAHLKASVSLTVTLRRRGYADVVVSATPGATRVEQEYDDGSSLRMQSRDYLIATDDYRFGGVLTEPRDGDLVIETVDGVERQYEARPFAGESCARPMDQSRVMWRVHTKLVTRTAQLLTENQLRAILGLMPVIGDEWNENELRHLAGIASLAA
jgi:hypothetical protein